MYQKHLKDDSISCECCKMKVILFCDHFRCIYVKATLYCGSSAAGTPVRIPQGVPGEILSAPRMNIYSWVLRELTLPEYLQNI